MGFVNEIVDHGFAPSRRNGLTMVAALILCLAWSMGCAARSISAELSLATYLPSGWRGSLARDEGFQVRSQPGDMFVVGCGNSGTSLMMRFIAQQAGVYASSYETAAFFHQPKTMAHAAQVLRTLDVEAMAACPRCTMWVEKTPRHVRALPRLFALSPLAKVVAMVRDPRDVVASYIERLHASKVPRTAAFEEGLHRWIIDVAYVAEWTQDPRVLVVRYEDLIAQPKAELDRVFAFLGLKYDFAHTMAFYKAAMRYQGQDPPETKPLAGEQGKMVHERRRAFQINQPVFDGRGRWQKAYPAGLSATEAKEVVQRSYMLMDFFDYSLQV